MWHRLNLPAPAFSLCKLTLLLGHSAGLLSVFRVKSLLAFLEYFGLRALALNLPARLAHVARAVREHEFAGCIFAAMDLGTR
ncbi:hypothetical protein LJR074_003185 [Acidovorax sp. LjRoot74]